MHPRRCRIRQDEGAHPAHRVPVRHRRRPTRATSLALTFTRKAAGELRHRLRTLGLRDRSSAGTFHAVAYAQLRRSLGRPSRAAAHPARTQRPDPRPALAAVRDRPRQAGRRRRRDRVGQGADGAGPTAYAKRPRPRAAGRRRRRTGHGRALRPLRGGEAQRRGWSTSTTCSALCARAIETDAEFAGRPAVAVPSPLRRRVPGREPAPVPALGGLARRPASTCASSATPIRRSTPGTAPTPRSSPSFADLLPRTADRHARATTTARRPRSWPPPTACSSAVRCRSCGSAPLGPKGPCPTSESIAPTPRKRGRSPRPSPAPTAGARAGRTMPCLSAPTPKPVLLAESLRAAGAPVRVRGQTPFLQVPEVREALGALAPITGRTA